MDTQKVEATTAPANLFEPEDLHPDLAKYVRHSDAGWTVLQHPLVYSVPYDEVLNRSCNARYAYNRQRLDAALAASNWATAIFVHERPWRLYRLLEWHVEGINGKRLPWRVLRALICEVWADAEPQDEMEWLWLWRRAHNGRLITDDRAAVRRLRREGPLRIYRGGSADDPTEDGVPQGLAWSTSEQTAEFFARRYSNPKPVIWTAVIPGIDEAYGYIEGRGEFEVVVDPMVVGDVDRLSIEPRDLPDRTIFVLDDGPEKEETTDGTPEG